MPGVWQGATACRVGGGYGGGRGATKGGVVGEVECVFVAGSNLDVSHGVGAGGEAAVPRPTVGRVIQDEQEFVWGGVVSLTQQDVDDTVEGHPVFWALNRYALAARLMSCHRQEGSGDADDAGVVVVEGCGCHVAGARRGGMARRGG